MLIDTHVHLDAAEFDVDRQEVIAAARRAGVGGFILPSVGIASSERVGNLAREIPGAVCAFGIHPLYVDRAQESDIRHLEALLVTHNAVAIGEIGLDGFVQTSDFARQEWFFVEQLKLAKRFDLPVILHLRRAQDRVLKYLRRHLVRGGFAHAFNGSLQQAEVFMKLGFCLGFGGTMTYPKSTRIRMLASTVPLDGIVLESDAPDISPAWMSGQRNEPANVARYAVELASLRGLPVNEVITATGANVRQVLGY